jgi:hypothetical protein
VSLVVKAVANHGDGEGPFLVENLFCQCKFGQQFGKDCLGHK